MKDFFISAFISFIIERLIDPHIDWYYNAYMKLHPNADSVGVLNSLLIYKFAIIFLLGIIVYGLLKLIAFLFDKFF